MSADRRYYGWVSRDQITKHPEWIDKWKVLIPSASDGHGRAPMRILGRPIVAAPGSACTKTYLVAGLFESAKEADNFAAYLCTKFVRYLVSLRKPTHNTTKGCFAFVPDLDMSKRWTDPELYARYELTPTEITEIDTQIRELEVREVQ